MGVGLLRGGDAALALLRDPSRGTPAGVDAMARHDVGHDLGEPLLDRCIEPGTREGRVPPAWAAGLAVGGAIGEERGVGLA